MLTGHGQVEAEVEAGREHPTGLAVVDGAEGGIRASIPLVSDPSSEGGSLLLEKEKWSS